MTDTTIYFGAPGRQEEILHPRGGVVNTRDRPSSVFRTGTGSSRVTRSISGKRQYTLNWQRLWYESFATLQAYHDGHNGPGPFVLHDPGQINWLTVNQSSATSHLNDTDGFSVSGTGSNISSSATAYHRGPRSLRWAFVGAASGTLTLDSPTPIWPGIPVVDGLEMAFSAYAKLDASVTSTLTLQLAWLDVDGNAVATTSGTPVSLTTDWQQATVATTPPEGAVYVLCKAEKTGAGSDAVVHLDEFQLERGSVTTSWRPGTGVFPVAVVSLAERWPWRASDYRESVVLILQEAGP